MNDDSFRASVVGAGDVAALFDASPWLTRFELYHRKRGTIATPSFNATREDGTPENERIHMGVILEPVIVEEACRRWGYAPLDTPHILDNGAGLGGHPDKLVTDNGEKVVLEVKTADWLVAKKWGAEPPLHYLLQNMTYQGLAGCVRGDMIVLVGGNELRRYQYDFRPTLYAEIERRVADFWRDVKAGNVPFLDYSRDGAALIESIGAPDDSIADLRDNLEAEQDALDWSEGKAMMKRGEAQCEAAKTRLIERIGAAGTALLPSFRIGASETKASPGKLVTPEMVGTYVGARKGWRRFDVKQLENA